MQQEALGKRRQERPRLPLPPDRFVDRLEGLLARCDPLQGDIEHGELSVLGL